MKVRAYIFTYNRPEMLRQSYNRLSSFGIEPIILDDGSDEEIDLPNVRRHDHRGKKGFWKTWDEALKDCKKNEADIYLFMPEDFLDIDITGVKNIHRKLSRNGSYAHNIINDGRNDKCWTSIRPIKLNYNLYRIGWVDCGFFCNREALDKIGYYMHSPGDNWFNIRETISSGVGMMLTKRLNEARVPCHRPEYSLAYHGEHESKMHPEVRRKNKLKSK